MSEEKKTPRESENSDQQLDIETPDTLASKYRYQRLLGEGANGKTWLARNIITGEQVAIKALKLAQSENFKSFELFMREAEVLESVHVQGVPRFYESIVTKEAGGECFIIQEYVSVPALQHFIADGTKIGEKQVLTILRETAKILKALHTTYVPPIIHRDIKPSNIMCGLDADGTLMSQLYLIDFGAVANPQNKSGGSTIAGTYGYMAPEQLLGECTPSSDLYSLGATALQMLTAIPPYDIQSDGFNIKYRETIQENAPLVSEGMIMLIGNLLEADPLNRPDSAAELITQINNVEAGLAPDGTEIPDDINVPWYKKPLIPFKKLARLIVRTQKQFNERIIAYSLKKMESSYIPTERWITVPGTIHCCTTRVTKCFEYTFVVKGQKVGNKKIKDRLYSGVCPVKNIWDMKPNAQEYSSTEAVINKYPAPCTVMYNPEYPRFNVIKSIDESDSASSENTEA